MKLYATRGKWVATYHGLSVIESSMADAMHKLYKLIEEN